MKSHLAPIDKETNRIFLEIIETMKENKTTMWNLSVNAVDSPCLIRRNNESGAYFLSNVVGLFLKSEGDGMEYLKMVLRPAYCKANISNEEFAEIVDNVTKYREYEVCEFNPRSEETTCLAYQFARYCDSYKDNLIDMSVDDMIWEIEKIVKANEGYMLLTDNNSRNGGLYLTNPEKGGDTICCRQIVFKHEYSNCGKSVCSLNLIDDNLQAWNMEDYFDDSEIKMVYKRVKENMARN